MLDMTLTKLKNQEFENVEKTCFDIESRLKGIGEIKSRNVFATAYLAYLVADKTESMLYRAKWFRRSDHFMGNVSSSWK